MALKQVRITIVPNEPMKVEVFGAEGTECDKLTQPLEALGLLNKTRTEDFYKNPQVNQSANIKL